MLSSHLVFNNIKTKYDFFIHLFFYQEQLEEVNKRRNICVDQFFFLQVFFWKEYSFHLNCTLLTENIVSELLY